IMGAAMGLASPCFGSTIALRRSTLEAIGGFEAFGDRLADDNEIGKAIRAKGLAVALPPIAVSHTCTETTLGALLLHELRWARTIRLVDPKGYAGSLITYQLPLAILSAICLAFSMPALAGLAAALA